MAHSVADRGFVASVTATVVIGLTVASGVAYATQPRDRAPDTTARPVVERPVAATPAPAVSPDPPAPSSREQAPEIPQQVLPGRTLVAYYGTAGTPALGVLGERSLRVMTERLRKAARPFGTRERPVQIVYELIVTVADPFPGRGRDFNHDIARADVRRVIAAAHRSDALVVLDLQPGRSDFLDVAKRWRWALRDPRVGLALDPEWRMGPRQVPGRVIGSVGAAEVNRVSGWLAELVREEELPQKVLVLHSFRTSMIRGLDRVRERPQLATVVHVDGFGTPGQKRATYDVVTRGWRGPTGFKLFYDEDVRRMSAAQVARLRPRVDLISFQ